MSPRDHIELPPDDSARAFDELVTLAGAVVQAWPANLPISALDDPRIVGVRFPDAAIVHNEMIQAVLAQGLKQPMGALGFGGKKVRDPAVWDLPSARLLTRRALLFFCKVHGATSAFVHDGWANIMEPGDYSYPHCHYDSQASLVYYLDNGDPDPKEKLNGRFHLADPRIPFCCSTHPERPTRGLLPDTRVGTLIMFPSEFLHFVHPYRGTRPRITLAWNISAGSPPPPEETPASAIPRGMFGS